MTDLAKLVVRLEAQTAKYQSELERANKKLDRFARNTTSITSKLGKGMAAGLAGAGAAILAMTAKVVDQGDQLDKLSTRLGISVENLSRLQFAADRTGVSSNTLNTALQRMQRRISEVAVTGKGEALPALDGLGLSAEKLTKLTPEQKFLAIADAMEGIEDPAEKVRLAMKLFDTEGVSLLQTMEGGSAAIAALASESDRLGNTMSGNTAKAAAQAKDALTNMQASLNGAAQEIFANLGPQIRDVSEVLGKALPVAARQASIAVLQLQSALATDAANFQQITGKMSIAIASLLKGAGYEGLASNFEAGGKDALSKAEEYFAKSEKIVSDGMARINGLLKDKAPDLKQIVPDQASVQGQNVTPTETKAAEKFAAETEKIVSLQKERFRRLHEEALLAEGLTRQLEQERYQRELEELQAEEDRLRQRLGKKFELEQEFAEARENAKIAHEGRMTAIEEDEQKVRDDLRKAQLQATGDFFGTLAALTKEGSKANRVLLAAEKAAALGRALIAMQEAIARANAIGFPANIPAIAQAAATGAQAIAAIRSVNVSGARAMGGPVRGGAGYLVGERGPEVFVPSQNGSVVPNHRVGGDVNVTLIEDASRAGQVNRTGDGVQVFVARIRAELAADIRNGRGLAQDLQGTYGLRRVGAV